MTKLEKLKYLKETPYIWRTLFDLYSWLNFTTKWEHDSYADYWYFIKICEEEMLRRGLKEIPQTINEKNYISKWFELNNKIDSLEKIKLLFFADNYKIILIRNKLRVTLYDENGKRYY